MRPIRLLLLVVMAAALAAACNMGPTAPAGVLPGSAPPSALPDPPLPDVSGRYTLTIRAASECQFGSADAHLPEAVRSRTYTAMVEQNGPRLEIRIPKESASYGLFFGYVQPSQVDFDLAWYFDGGREPSIVEDLDETTSLAIGGFAVTTLSGSGMRGTLEGSLTLLRRDIHALPVALCTSARHEFVLTR